MKTINEYSQLLDEFIKRSALIDRLVIESEKSPDLKQELEKLRAKQHKANKILQTLEVSSITMWENIGYGG